MNKQVHFDLFVMERPSSKSASSSRTNRSSIVPLFQFSRGSWRRSGRKPAPSRAASSPPAQPHSTWCDFPRTSPIRLCRVSNSEQPAFPSRVYFHGYERRRPNTRGRARFISYRLRPVCGSVSVMPKSRPTTCASFRVPIPSGTLGEGRPAKSEHTSDAAERHSGPCRRTQSSPSAASQTERSHKLPPAAD